MNFLIPWGFLGLLSIPVLLLIYIIHPKYREKTVSSTYIWRLSLKYQKKKIPFQWLRRSLLFLLQVLILCACTLMLSRPYILQTRDGGEKVIILDASAGMLAEKEGSTRFARAKEEIRHLVERKSDEDRVTIILADEEASYVVHRTNAEDVILHALERLSCTYGVANLENALQLANRVLEENESAEVILYTDRDYAEPGYVTVKNVSNDEWNAAVLSLEADLRNGYCEFAADIASYGRDAEIAVSLHIDGEWRSTKTLFLKEDEVVPVVFWDEEEIQVFEYESASVTVHVEDHFPYDNTLTIYRDGRGRQVELVSESPNMLSMALYAAPENEVFMATTGSSSIPKVIYYEGYDLYVFEGKLPAQLPRDGGLLLLNPEGSMSGLSLGEAISGTFTAERNEGISSAHEQLLRGLTPENIHLTKYTKALSYDGYEILMRVGDDPVLLSKDVDGVPVVVLLFDIHYSDLPLLLEFPMLVGNMCAYAAPSTLERTGFDVGCEVKIRQKPHADTLRIRYEDAVEETVTESTYDAFPVRLTVDRPGTYIVTQDLSNGKIRTDRFFVRVAEEESDFSAQGDVLSGDEYQNPYGTEAGGANVRHDRKEFFKYIAIVLLMLLVIEWGVQYREQF